VVLGWVLVEFAGWPAWSLAVLAAALTPAGIWAATLTARSEGMKDPRLVVVDEVLGQWITLAGAARLDLAHLAAGFLLFRLFDIWKPWPVNRLEELPEGAGIVSDDLMAGVYGALVLIVARWFNF
jgi:phosphatidylglycerophosphatase A